MNNLIATGGNKGGGLENGGANDGSNNNDGASQQIQVSPDAKMLIRSLLTVQEAQRPSAVDILS